jgi:hypothetical protein
VTPQDEQREYLQRLAGALADRELSAHLDTQGREPYLRIENPAQAALNERVFCHQAEDGTWCYWWPWRQPIGSVDDLGAVASKILTVLRTVEGVS